MEHATNFLYTLDGRGRIVLQGLSPEETLEFEFLLHQLEQFRSPQDQRRLDGLCRQHRRSLCRGDAANNGSAFHEEKPDKPSSRRPKLFRLPWSRLRPHNVFARQATGMERPVASKTQRAEKQRNSLK